MQWAATCVSVCNVTQQDLSALKGKQLNAADKSSWGRRTGNDRARAEEMQRDSNFAVKQYNISAWEMLSFICTSGTLMVAANYVIYGVFLPAKGLGAVP